MHKDDIPIFQQPWWLNAVCGNNEWTALVECANKQEIDCIWPVYVKRFGPIYYMTMPPLVQQFEPLKKEDLPDWENIIQLYPFLTYQRLHVPVYMAQWLKKYRFEIRNAYTYQIDCEPNTDKCLRKMNVLARRNIRKAEGQLRIVFDFDIDTTFRLVNQSLSRHGIRPSIGQSLLSRTIAACKIQNQGAIFKAIDSDGKVHAAAFVVWDNQKMYYLLAGMDENITQVGASRLLMWHTMQLAFAKGLHYDFHGGMSPEVGAVYASMGASPVPYLRAVRYRPAFLKQIITTAKRIYAPNDRLFH